MLNKEQEFRRKMAKEAVNIGMSLALFALDIIVFGYWLPTSDGGDVCRLVASTLVMIFFVALAAVILSAEGILKAFSGIYRMHKKEKEEEEKMVRHWKRMARWEVERKEYEKKKRGYTF